MDFGKLTGKDSGDKGKLPPADSEAPKSDTVTTGESSEAKAPTTNVESGPQSDTSTQINTKPEDGPTPDTGDKPVETTNTANASQTDSATTTDLDPLTQHQVGKNLDASGLGRNSDLSAGASDSATRQQTLSEVEQERAGETADAGLNAQLERQKDTSGLFDAGGNAVLGIGAQIAGAPEGGVSFTSHPTKNLKLGRFQFENSTLTLKGDDVSEFEDLLDKQPAFVKNTVKKIDTGAANALAKQYLDQNRMIQGIDNAGSGPTRTVGSSL